MYAGGSLRRKGVDGMRRKDVIADLLAASREGYAVPHFNFASFFELEAIMEAAAELEAPVFAASLPKVTETYGPAVLRAAADELKRRTGARVYLHLDHSRSVTLCKEAVDAGYDSVMIDASRLPLGENIAAIFEVAEYAHARDCAVEGEVGKIKSRGDEGDYQGEDCLVQAGDALAAAEESGADYLAVAIGTAHGFYQGEPKIDLQRLEDVAAKVKIPLVLHGGTGVPQADVRACIKGGIAKVNVGTIIRYTYLSRLREEIERQGAFTPPVDLICPSVTDSVKEVVKGWIEVCMAERRTVC